MDVGQQGFYRLQGAHLLLQRHYLPEVLGGVLLYLVFGELQLQLAHFLAQTGQLVAVYYLPAGEDGLHGAHTGHHAVFHHRHTGGVGQGRQRFGRKRLGQGLSQGGVYHFAGVDVHLGHAVVGGEPESGAAHVGKVMGVGFLALLAGGLYVLAGLAHAGIVLQRRVGELGEGECGGCLGAGRGGGERQCQ